MSMGNTSKIKIECYITKKDFSAYNFYHTFIRTGIWYKYLLFMLFMLGLSILHFCTGSSSFGIMFLIFMVLPPAILFKNYLLENAAVCKAHQLGAEGRWFYTLELDAERVLAYKKNEHAFYYWKDIWRIVSRSGYYFIYTAKAKAFILPPESIREQQEPVRRLMAAAAAQKNA